MLLVREGNDESATFGHLFFTLIGGKSHSFYTLEPPSGLKKHGPIPAGTYQLVPHYGVKWRNVFALVNPKLGVTHFIPSSHPNPRTAILIHPANFGSELKGCIAVGLTRAKERDKRRDYLLSSFIGGSRAACALLFKHINSLPPEKRTLRIE